jgi:serine/threonine protein kinase
MPDTTRELPEGTVLQNCYRIDRKLGEGGFGFVYEARDLSLGEARVAIKHFIGHPLVRDSFLDEAKIQACLYHRALPTVKRFFKEGDAQFIVMELINGDDLEKLLRQRGVPFTVAEVTGWVTEILDVLDYLHKERVIHRDIKPHNLMLTERRQIYLLDFGLAKKSTPDKPGRSILGGTPEYSPPEQLIRNGNHTDARSDLYSFGATLYHLLTGKAPISAELRHWHLSRSQPDPLIPAHQLNSQLPQSVAEVISRAMAYRRDDRYQHAGEMFRHWQKAVRHPLIAAAQPASTERVAPALKRTLVLRITSAFRTAPVWGRQRKSEIASLALLIPLLGWLMWALLGSSARLNSADILSAARRVIASAPAEPTTAVQPEPVSSPPARTEVLRYWLELEDRRAERFNGRALPPTGRFRFHFAPNESGCIYLIAPNHHQAPTVFLNARPAAGVNSNLIAAGADFRFPDGNNWIEAGTGTEPVRFIAIFAPAPLNDPGFLNAESAHELDEAEQQALQSFRAQYTQNAPETIVHDDHIVVTALSRSGEPVIFEIEISRQPTQ